MTLELKILRSSMFAFISTVLMNLVSLGFNDTVNKNSNEHLEILGQCYIKFALNNVFMYML